jgi:hypothetical protein
MIYGSGCDKAVLSWRQSCNGRIEPADLTQSPLADELVRHVTINCAERGL